MKRNTFKNKVVIVTGASKGIGKELALQLAEQGACLSLAARSEKQLALVEKACSSIGSKTLSIPTDIGSEEQCRKLIKKTANKFGRIDMLINNAGINQRSFLEDLKNLNLFDKLLKVNFRGSISCTYYALPYLKKTKGRIVGISSIAGKIGLPGFSAYCASKFALAGFLDSIRHELKINKVSVTSIFPGFVTTTKSAGIMPAAKCARIILKAAAERKDEVVMTLYEA